MAGGGAPISPHFGAENSNWRWEESPCLSRERSEGDEHVAMRRGDVIPCR